MESIKIIAVGSKNPVKIRAVENVVTKLWPKAKVVSVATVSRVNEQPRSDKEAIRGAKNRARSALKKNSADLGIGIESCVVETAWGLCTSGWAVAVNKKGETGIGGGARLLLPEKIAQKVRQDRELGPVMDEFVGDHNTKQKYGAIGLLTNGLIDRTAATENSVIYSLVKFINPRYYRT